MNGLPIIVAPIDNHWCFSFQSFFNPFLHRLGHPIYATVNSEFDTWKNTYYFEESIL